MRKCSTYIIEWDHIQEGHLNLPKNCLSYTITNRGESQIMIDDTITLDPGETHPVLHHSGYYHTGQIELKISNNQNPYSNFTKVLVQLTVAMPGKE